MTLKNTLFWKFDTIRVVPNVETLVGVVPPLVGVVPPLVGVVPIVETLVGLVPIVETLVGVSYFIHIHGRVYIIPVIRQLSFPSSGTRGR